jgi:hypothetical protein
MRFRSFVSIVIFLFAYSCMAFNANAQGSTDFISYTANSTISFNLNNTNDLLNPQLITNAFCLSTQSKSKNAYYYVQASSSTSTSTPMPVSNMILSFYSTTCPSGSYTSLNTADIPLSTSSQLLFEQYRQHVMPYDFCYSVKIPAVGTTYRAGTYNFSILFTMTEP